MRWTDWIYAPQSHGSVSCSDTAQCVFSGTTLFKQGGTQQPTVPNFSEQCSFKKLPLGGKDAISCSLHIPPHVFSRNYFHNVHIFFSVAI